MPLRHGRDRGFRAAIAVTTDSAAVADSTTLIAGAMNLAAIAVFQAAIAALMAATGETAVAVSPFLFLPTYFLNYHNV